MIDIRILRRRDGLELSAEGHAGQAPRGQDLVCAGVSALLYGFVAYLETLPPIATAGAGAHLTCSQGDGVLRVSTRGLGGADTSGWQVTEAGLRLIAEAYPACVTIREGAATNQPHKEVKGEHHE